MNKYITKIMLVSAVFLVGAFGLVSCEDYLDKAPQSDIGVEQPYKNFKNFQGFTEELYNCIPLLTASQYHNNWNFGEDEYWEPNEPRMFANQIEQGNYWDWNYSLFNHFKKGGNPNNNNRFDKGNLWGLSWYGIRKANVGIANLELMIEGTQEERNLIAGQLYFFRAWYHFTLMQYWGGLPYIDQVLPSDEVLKLERLSYQETADRVTEDFKRAAELLPVDWDETTAGKATLGNNNLRINKVMALAYLGKNLLWAGSPLMNYESTGSQTYNTEYCKQAADALAEALKISETTGRYQLADFSQYSQLFYTYNQSGKIPGLKEAIFMENLAETGGRWRWNQVNDYRPMTINASGIKVNPTANYVDYYGMANGMPIVDPVSKDSESGYDPEYPWKNRDPRFYHDIIFDGVKCTNSNLGENRQYASLFTNGLYRTSNGTKGVLTGYMNSKFTSKLMNDYDGFKENNVMVLSFMRLADVYLMYAEATAIGYGTPQSSASGYSLTAVQAVNKIRTRAGVGMVADKFLGNTETFMSEVRRERAVELAFEGHRFGDLRRWMLLLQRPYTLKMAIEFDRAKDVTSAELFANPQNGRVLNLRQTILFERKFELKHYWFPFLRDDVNMYKEFKQNPGW